MRTFIQEQNQTQQQASPDITRSNTEVPAGSRQTHQILHLQRTIGNRAVQRLLKATAEESKAGSTRTASPSAEHDFSGIPVHPPASATIQTKLEINKPGDEYEQEADRVSDQLMTTPAHPAVNATQPNIQRFSEQSAGQSNAQMDAAPASVDQTLAGSGMPLEPALRQDMEQRFGHDFSRVRVHSDAAAEQSARDVNAKAYTVGDNIVFGAGRFALGTQEGRRLIAHELTHVVQQSGSDGFRLHQNNDKSGLSPISHGLAHVAQPAPSNVVQRDLVKDAAGNIVSYEFRIGHELTEDFAKHAKKLTADGTLTNADIVKLKADATKARDTVSDHERMFMAGLLDATNVATLKATSINSTATITFALTTINDAGVKQVIEAGRPVSPASVVKPLLELAKATGKGDFGEASKQLGKLETASEKEIRSLIGASFKAQAAAVIAYAQAHSIPLVGVLSAMQLAASDNTPSDRLLAAAAYAVAAAAGHPLASDLMYGIIHVDALDPTKFASLPGSSASRRAMYVGAAPMNPSLAGLKGDTIYMPTNFDIEDLNDRSNVIHELRHAQDDKAVSPTAQVTFPAQQGLEVTAYKAQGRYILDQLDGQTATDRALSVTRMAPGVGDLELMGMLIEAKTDQTKYKPVVEQVFAALASPRQKSAADVGTMLGKSTALLESVLEAEIRKAYGITAASTVISEGLAGESLIHWLHRL